jgi:SAM-dependent methyltransferase
MPTTDIANELAELHASTYDALASEYERRAESLVPVTEDAVQWMARYLAPNGKVLDLGCGVGLAVSLFMNAGFQAVGLDISPKMVEHAKTRNPSAKFLLEDFLKADFEDRFDGVFAFAFVHLFPKDVALEAMRKIRRMLNTDGIFYVGTTKSTESREGFAVKKDYEGEYRRYRKLWTKDELEGALADSGFVILEVKEYADPFGKVWVDFMARKK